ncbi:MAG: competence/damage-inducible protein A [Bacteroidales bacterium]|nr:competence/damage-inducible protein A [Bacteroidales bacterium]
MDVSVIVIGDELLIGQVIDTNSGWIARHLNLLGWNVRTVRVIGDSSDKILNAVNDAFNETDIVLTTGGLGPTKDDITKMTLCQYFGGEMVLDKEVLKNVEDVIKKRHLSMNPLNEAQAIVPTSCRVIQNQVGTAPIMWFEKDGKVLVSMPGVPFEMETMMEREVIPQLLNRFCVDSYIEHRTFIVVGYAESALAIKLEQFENELPSYIHLAYLPVPGIVRLRLTGESKNKEAITQDMKTLSDKLHNILGSAIVSYDDKPLSEIIGEKLKERGLTLATAESCTGGNVAHQITAIAGSSAYFLGSVVSYTNEIKQELLNVSADVLKEYGAVSEPTVRQMAQGVCELLGADCAMATSGIAGPGGATATKPVGTVWLAAKCGDRLESQCKHFPGSRDRVIDRATTEVQIMLLKMLSE